MCDLVTVNLIVALMDSHMTEYLPTVCWNYSGSLLKTIDPLSLITYQGNGLHASFLFDLIQSYSEQFAIGSHCFVYAQTILNYLNVETGSPFDDWYRSYSPGH